MPRQPKQCSAEGCENTALFLANSKPSWCDDHITEILRQGGLEPLEPFRHRKAYRLTRCLACNAEAHYKFDYTLEQNRLDTPTCRACFWREWYVSAWRIGVVNRPVQIQVGSVDRGREVIADLGGGPYQYRCLECRRLSISRPGDFPDVCGCSEALGGRRGELPRLLSSELREQFIETVNRSKETADTIRSTSTRLVVWQDTNCGHTWEATPAQRQGVPRWRCPKCQSILDSLAFHFPDISAEWSADNPLTPWQVRPTGTLAFKPEWRCIKVPTHVWRASLGPRTSGGGRCPE